MNAISDSEKQYSKAYAQEVWSAGMCFSLFLSPHSQPICPGLNHIHTLTAAHESERIQAWPRHTDPVKAAPKKNKLMTRNASQESPQGISESTLRILLRKTLNRIYPYKIIHPWTLFTLESCFPFIVPIFSTLHDLQLGWPSRPGYFWELNRAPLIIMLEYQSQTWTGKLRCTAPYLKLNFIWGSTWQSAEWGGYCFEISSFYPPFQTRIPLCNQYRASVCKWPKTLMLRA